jgi:hypothetical protein
VRSVKTCPCDDPGGNHLSPMTTCTLKFIYKDILHPGMFGVSSLSYLTSSFTFRYHYLRWTSLIIHPAMFFASLSERSHQSYDILGGEREVMFCISYLHTFILQAASKVIRLDMRSLPVFQPFVKTEREKMDLNGFTPSRPSKSFSAMSGGYSAFEKSSRAKGYIIRFWHRRWLSWTGGACRTTCHLPWADINIRFFTFKRVVPSKSSEECNGPLEQKPQGCE